MNIIKIIKNFRYKRSAGFLFALTLHKAYIFFKYRLFSDQFYIKKEFNKTFNYNLNLSEPKTLNEKLQWYKLNFKHPLIVQCADKYAVRSYVSKTIGDDYLIPLLFHTDNPKEIIPENLPDSPFIIKANHTAGTNHIIRDKKNADWKRIQIDCKWWLKTDYSFSQKEWQYSEMKPRIVIEKLLSDEKGNIPSDYKLHFFNGNFEFLQIDIGRFSSHKRLYFDKNWNLLPFTWRKDKFGYAEWDKKVKIEKPKHLELMIQAGAKLAQPFPYVRTDFYYNNDQIYFGELTFHHGGGYEHFTPNEWDLHFGKKLPLNEFEENQLF